MNVAKSDSERIESELQSWQFIILTTDDQNPRVERTEPQFFLLLSALTMSC